MQVQPVQNDIEKWINEKKRGTLIEVIFENKLFKQKKETIIMERSIVTNFT
jgi:hypothetical protein